MTMMMTLFAASAAIGMWGVNRLHPRRMNGAEVERGEVHQL